MASSAVAKSVNPSLKLSAWDMTVLPMFEPSTDRLHFDDKYEAWDEKEKARIVCNFPLRVSDNNRYP
eukprot:scaffold2442_cov146-Cylindrotheca_fusiformis.AAC.12